MTTERDARACSPSCARASSRWSPRRPSDGAASTTTPFRGELRRRAAARALSRELLAELPLPRGLLAARPDRAPLRDLDRPRRRAPDDPLRRGRPRRWRCSARCTRPGTASTSRASTRSSRARRSRKPRSLGLHESQSRLWENWVGRSRPYLERLLPRPARARSRTRFDGDRRRASSIARREPGRALADPGRGRRGHLQPPHPDPLRARARDLRGRRSSCADLPEAWNARYRDYLGLEVPDDAHGVLQDVHWAGGAFGYFPTYSLGNVIAGQLWEAAEPRPGRPRRRRSASGELASLGDWLREHVHRHGRRLSPAEILERAGCGELSVEPLLGHLRGRVRLATQA